MDQRGDHDDIEGLQRAAACADCELRQQEEREPGMNMQSVVRQSGKTDDSLYDFVIDLYQFDHIGFASVFVVTG